MSVFFGQAFVVDLITLKKALVAETLLFLKSSISVSVCLYRLLCYNVKLYCSKN